MLHEAEHLLREFVAYVEDAERRPNVLSIYLVVDPAEPANQAETPAWQIYLRNALAEIENQLNPEQVKQWKTVRLSDTSEKTEWARTRLRLEAYLDSYLPQGKTLVLFVSAEQLLAYELPVRLRNYAHYGWMQIKDFLYAIDEYEQHLVVLFAQDKARAVNLFLGTSASDVTVNLDQTWQRKDSRKTAHEAQIARRQDELDRRFARYMADEINQLFVRERDIDRLILGGNVQLAHAVLAFLHPSVARKVISVVKIPFEAPPHEIAASIREIAYTAERDHELILVQDTISMAKGGKRAALGLSDVHQALDRYAVSVLILPYPIETPILAGIVDELLVKALHSGSQIEFVRGEAADLLLSEGGIAAQLYYSLPLESVR
ncbi:MAG: hypothetical protein D6749_07030 [Chloroflexota bacterium]|jgi:hypothetical protein|nr:MAG: hypothetical protein D6749_07030 [Chloroflexota bacterium]